MKKLMMFNLIALLSLTLFTGMAIAAKYKPGTYKGTAVGYTKKQKPGKIEVEVTVDADAIKDIKIVTYEQTTKPKKAGKKDKQVERVLQAQKEIPAKIIETQSIAVDSVAKASRSSMGIELAVAEALEKATVKYKDGKYTGESKGYHKKNKPGKIVAEVTITGGKIANIELVTFNQTTKKKEGKKGKQAENVLKAKEEVPASIIEKQSTAVDSTAKASMSSDGIKLAVARALEQAR
ncbi:MAG: hypothetical protein CR984_04165 [Proteobacteria bacterium]|nr:MAG: hypothetical protein CR984_04165 [Pseudomonadota bacterium]PIE67855.1 MAG: hypothetical protein CSA23_01885 [Deltaproteobacteria bacterium]